MKIWWPQRTPEPLFCCPALQKTDEKRCPNGKPLGIPACPILPIQLNFRGGLGLHRESWHKVGPPYPFDPFQGPFQPPSIPRTL
jgi:hypothetical protein